MSRGDRNIDEGKLGSFGAKVKAIFPEADLSEYTEDAKEGRVHIELSEMYDRPQVTFDKLQQLSELFKTKDINLSDGDSYGGCESCDYGSKYSVEIAIGGIDFNKLS